MANHPVNNPQLPPLLCRLRPRTSTLDGWPETPHVAPSFVSETRAREIVNTVNMILRPLPLVALVERVARLIADDDRRFLTRYEDVVRHFDGLLVWSVAAAATSPWYMPTRYYVSFAAPAGGRFAALRLAYAMLLIGDQTVFDHLHFPLLQGIAFAITDDRIYARLFYDAGVRPMFRRIWQQWVERPLSLPDLPAARAVGTLQGHGLSAEAIGLYDPPASYVPDQIPTALVPYTITTLGKLAILNNLFPNRSSLVFERQRRGALHGFVAVHVPRGQSHLSSLSALCWCHLIQPFSVSVRPLRNPAVDVNSYIHMYWSRRSF
ncbi:hypothetical protein OF83DRAFT_1179691 [Amylostereum chailletii]|nr:hypothetical protein OF83DRAFT_1179691 [Amylostereum chailletii]